MTTTSSPVAEMTIEAFSTGGDFLVNFVWSEGNYGTKINPMVLSLMLGLEVGSPDAFVDRQFTQYEAGGRWVETTDSGCPY